jgi:hypothetical protein
MDKAFQAPQCSIAYARAASGLERGKFTGVEVVALLFQAAYGCSRMMAISAPNMIRQVTPRVDFTVAMDCCGRQGLKNI